VGTQNVEGAVIMHEDRAVVSELAFGRYAMVVPHENQDNTALFVVISGAGWVQVGRGRHGQGLAAGSRLRGLGVDASARDDHDRGHGDDAGKQQPQHGTGFDAGQGR